jgi:16S rRNA (uracil1498-N3)-methyltransferase
VSAPAWAADCDARALVVVSDPLRASTRVVVDGADGHHLQRVRRLGVDDVVVLADGDGGWVRSRVVDVGEGTLTVATDGCIRSEPRLEPRLTVAFAPAKRDHGVEVTHQLVELGVDRIVPLHTDRGVVRWDGSRGAKHVEKLRRVAREAATQCRRARVPEIDAPRTVAELLAGGADGVVVADRAGGGVLAAALPTGPDWTIVVGPEGGLSPAERALTAAAPCVSVAPHVLRAVTAPAAVAASLGALRAASRPPSRPRSG